MKDAKLPGRVEYGDRLFDREHLAAEPMELFREWFSEAVSEGLPEANGMCLCTSDPGEGPDGRIVLLKGYSETGFTFFTHFSSAKGRHLADDPRACLVFWWQPLRRQVRVRGRVERVADEESDDYFQSRPRESQVGAWASAQSQPIDSRETLEARVAEASERYPLEVPRPPGWGGFRLLPDSVEFWQGRDSRLHDRFLYRRAEDGSWSVQRLMP